MLLDNRGGARTRGRAPARPGPPADRLRRRPRPRSTPPPSASHGYREAMDARRASRSTRSSSGSTRTTPTQAEARRARAARAAADRRPTAIFTGNNRHTVGALRALRGLEHEVALVGFDDFELADLLAMPTTVVRHDSQELGAARRRARLRAARRPRRRRPAASSSPPSSSSADPGRSAAVKPHRPAAQRAAPLLRRRRAASPRFRGLELDGRPHARGVDRRGQHDVRRSTTRGLSRLRRRHAACATRSPPTPRPSSAPEHVARCGADPGAAGQAARRRRAAARCTSTPAARSRASTRARPRQDRGLDHRRGRARARSVHAGFADDVELDDRARLDARAGQRGDARRAARAPRRAPATRSSCPAGTPHAIGAGILLVELQEPTDLSITSSGPASSSPRTTATSASAGTARCRRSTATRLGRRAARGASRGAAPRLAPRRAADPYFRAERAAAAARRSTPASRSSSALAGGHAGAPTGGSLDCGAAAPCSSRTPPATASCAATLTRPALPPAGPRRARRRVVSDALLLGLDVGTTRDQGGGDRRATAAEVAHGRAPTPWREVPTGAEVDPDALLDAAVDGRPRGARRGARTAPWRASAWQAWPRPACCSTRRGEPGRARRSPGTTRAGATRRRGWPPSSASERFAARTGLPCSELCTLAKYAWMRDHLPGRARAACAGSTSASGSCAASAARRRPSCSLASRTGFYDLHERRPWADALAWAQAPDGLMPEPSTPAPRWAARAPARLGRAEGAVLTVGGHDHLAAAVGADAAGDGDVLDSSGTAEAFVRAVAPLAPDAVAHSVRRGVTVGWHAVPGRQALLGAVWAGSALSRVLALLGVPVEERHELEALALDAEPGTLSLHGVNDDELSLRGITRDASPARLYRAALEAVGADGAEVLRVMEIVGGGPARRLVVTGGWAAGVGGARGQARAPRALRAFPRSLDRRTRRRPRGGPGGRAVDHRRRAARNRRSPGGDLDGGALAGGSRHRQELRPRAGAARRRLHRLPRRGGRADRRQRRRQEHAGQDALGRPSPDSGEIRFEGEAGRVSTPDGRARARHRDRLPGPRARARTSSPRRTCSSGASRCAGRACSAGSASSTTARCASAPRRRSTTLGVGVQDVEAPVAVLLGRPAPGRRRRARRHVGEQGRLHGRADRGARRRADAQGARADQARARHRPLGRPDLAQHARRPRGVRPRRGAAPRPARRASSRPPRPRWRTSSAR